MERYRERLNGVDGIQLNCVQDDVKSNYAYFPVVFEERLFGASRAEVFDKLAENGIGARKYFYPLTNTFECFHGKYDVTKTPVAPFLNSRYAVTSSYTSISFHLPSWQNAQTDSGIPQIHCKRSNLCGH